MATVLRHLTLKLPIVHGGDYSPQLADAWIGIDIEIDLQEMNGRIQIAKKAAYRSFTVTSANRHIKSSRD